MGQFIQDPNDTKGRQVIEKRKWHGSTIAVQVADTDYGGGVYHGKYFALYNQARDIFMEDMGVSYFSLMQQNLNLSVAELHTHFFKPLFYGDTLCINTRITWLGSKSMGVAQEMQVSSSETEDSIGINHVDMNLVCTSDGKAVPLPRELIRAIHSYYGL